jgi:hypothetical protein
MMRTARYAKRLCLAALALGALAGNTRAAEIHPVIQAGLLDAAASIPFVLEYNVVRLGGGVKFGRHVGATGDLALLAAGGYMFWPLVPTATVFWDFDPLQTWQRRQAYFKVSVYHTSYTIDDMDYWTGVKMSLGASYTWYALTPHIEADVIFPPHSLPKYPDYIGGTAGITIGGTYVIQPRRRHDED